MSTLPRQARSNLPRLTSIGSSLGLGGFGEQNGALVVAMRLNSASPPAWLRGRRGGKRQGLSHRAQHAKRRADWVTNAVDVTSQEPTLRARGAHSAQLDRQLAVAAAGILGFDEQNGHDAVESHSACSFRSHTGASHGTPAFDGGNYGGGLDRSYIRFQERASDTATFTAVTGSDVSSYPPAQHGNGNIGAKEAVAARKVMRSYGGAADPSATISGTHSSAALGAVAYVGGVEFTKAHGQSAPSPDREAAASGKKQTVELDHGEQITMQVDRCAALRRTLRCAGDSHTIEGLLNAVVSPAGEVPSTRRLAEKASHANRVMRQQAKEEHREDLVYGTTRHPCVLQGAGCCGAVGHHQHRAVCLLRDYPAACCVEKLQTGKCKAALSGRCPWHHGETGRVGLQTMLAECLFASEGVSEDAEREVNARLQRGIPRVEAILQVFVNLVGAALETPLDTAVGETGAESERPRLYAAEVAAAGSAFFRWRVLLGAMRQQEICNVSDFGSPLRLQTTPCGDSTLTIDTAFVAQTVEASIPDDERRFSTLTSGSTASENHAMGFASTRMTPEWTSEAQDLEEMWAESEKEEKQEAQQLRGQAALDWTSDFHGARGGASPQLPHLLEELSALWSSYFICENPSELSLSPLLTDFVLCTAAEMSLGKTGEGPHSLFWSATRHLVSRRFDECETVVSATDPMVGGLEEHRVHEPAGAGSNPTHLRWAALSLLKDLILVRRLRAVVSNSQPPAKTESQERYDKLPLTESFLSEKGADANEGADQSAKGAVVVAASPFLDTVVGAVVGNGLVSPPANATPSAAAHANLAREWNAVHIALLKICAGLLRSESMVSLLDNKERGTALRVMGAANQHVGHPLSLLAFAQTALLSLVAESSEAVGDRYEHAVLNAAGWQPWTDVQMFSAFQSVVYTPHRYAQHHLPLLASSCEASLLNAMLQCTTQHIERIHGLSHRGPVGSVFETPCGDLDAAVPWLRAHEQRRLIPHSTSLQRCVPVAMAFLAALEDLSALVTSHQRALQDEFRARRLSYEKEEDERNRSVHTRKYRKTEHTVAAVASDALMTPLMDCALPQGTVAVSASATASLIRLLLESGKPYHALRLSATIARTTRMLRHASRQAAPQLVEGEKKVHRLVRDAKTGKKRVVKIRVPTLRVKTGEGRGVGLAGATLTGVPPAESAWPDGGSRSPVGLLYQVDAAVVEEMVRTGLRMGPAGAKLADGVRDDCVRGHMLDFADSRCLPTPDSQDVLDFVRAPRGRAPLRCTHAAANVLRLRGVGQDQASAGRSLSVAQNSQLSANYPHRRIAPTPLFLEMLLTHTAPSDTARHQHYNRLFTADTQRFASDGVITARQCVLSHQRHQWALQAKECVWVPAVRSLARLASAPAIPKHEASVLPAWRILASQLGENDEAVAKWGAAPSHNDVQLRQAAAGKLSVGGKAMPTTTEELRNMLLGASEHSELVAGEGEMGSTALSGKERRRRSQIARNPLLQYRPEALMTHLTTITPGGEGHFAHAQRLLHLLLSATVGALVGMPAESLNDAQPSSWLAHTVLAQATMAAAQLDAWSRCGKRNAGVSCFAAYTPILWIERVCQALLLSRVWHRREGAQVHQRDGELALPLSSSPRAAVAISFDNFLSLQLDLLQRSLLNPASTPGEARPERVHQLTQINLIKTCPPDSVPAWPLFESLQSFSHSVVNQWLQVTLLSPSPGFLAWLLVHIDRKDDNAVDAFHRWIDALSGSGHHPDTLQALFANSRCLQPKPRHHSQAAP